MALPVLDGNQSATTLSSVVTGGEHIVAHSVVSLGSTAISNITSAVSGSVVSVSNFPASQSTTFGAVTGSVSVLNFPSTQTVAGTVTANLFGYDQANDQQAKVQITEDGYLAVALQANNLGNIPISGTVTIGNSVTIGSLPAISGTVTIGAIGGSVTIPVRLFAEAEGGPSSGQDTLVLCDSSGQLLINAKSGGSSVLGYDGNAFVSVKQVSGSSVTIGSLPAISGTVTVGAVSTSVTVAQIQGTSVTTSNFTSTTASQTLVSANSARRGLTVFNEGAGNLHICAGTTATTVAYQLRLSAGDYWECPTWQTALTHSAQFSSAGTARVVEII